MTRLRGVTAYQMEILTAVQRCAGEGFDMDLDQLVDTLSWQPTKQSLQFSIRALIAKRMLTKTGFQVRRGRKRVCFRLDSEGLAVLDPRGVAPAAAPTGPGSLVPGVSTDLVLELDEALENLSTISIPLALD
jgi:hypothetical protein